MRLASITFGFVITLLMLNGYVMADDSTNSQAAPAPDTSSEKVSIKTNITPHEIRKYKVNVSVVGKLLSPDDGKPVDVDTSYSLVLQHRYGKREGDGLLPLEISVLTGQITVADQMLAITPDMFPRLSVLLDKDLRISNIFGVAGTQYAKSAPGITYSNMILLFFPYGADVLHSINDKWKAIVPMPIYSENYQFDSMIKSLEEIDGEKVARIAQNIGVSEKDSSSEKSDYASKISAESTFSIQDGKLIKSHVECQILRNSKIGETSRQEATGLGANMKLDIALMK